jgi:hypothetical protein
MSIIDEWCVVVFKCKPEQVKTALPDFYHFVKGLDGVKSLHFLVRDRVDDEAVFSFRVMVDPKQKRLIRSKIAYKLGTYFSKDKFAVDPTSDSPLHGYVAWDLEKRLAVHGLKKVDDFTDFLCAMSKLVVEMVEKEYFASNDRVEIAHVMAWMLGCTEYGVLSTKAMEIGYYDRIEDKYCAYLKQEFPNSLNQ